METPQQLAGRLESAGSEFLDYLRGLDESLWGTKTAEEGWPVAVTVHHVAIGTRFTGDLVTHAADGGDITWNDKFIDDANDQHAEVFADVGKEEAIAALEQVLPETVAKIRGIDPEKLNRQMSQPMEYRDSQLASAGEIADRMLIKHIQDHLKSIRDSVRAK